MAIAAVAPAYAPLILEISVNGTRAGEAVVVMRDPEGAMFVPAASLAAHHVRLSGLIPVAIEGAPYVRLADLAGQSTTLNEADQVLELILPADLFEANDLSFAGADQGPMTPGGTGAILNYGILAAMTSGGPAVSGTAELTVFSGASFAQATAIAGWSDDGLRATRLDTSWTHDFPGSMRSLQIGDSVSRGGVGGSPLRFGGVQYGRNFATNPGFVTLPMQTLSGSAALPSVVDVYLNNILLESRTVAPGPFAITDVPIVTGNGEVSLVVRDALGRETVVRQSYYASPGLLRAGLHDYSYEIGFLRRDYGRASFRYGALMASTTHRFGVTDRLTAEAHAEASARTQAAGVAADLALPGIGLISGSAAASRSDAGAGARLGLGFEGSMSGFSLGVHGDYSSAGYRSLGLADNRNPPRLTAQAFAGFPTPFGSFGASYLLRLARGGEPHSEFVSANGAIRVGGLGTLHLGGRRSLRGKREMAAEASFTMSLGTRASARAGLRHADGRIDATAGIQQSPPDGKGWGYRASAALGTAERFDGGVRLQTDFGEYDADVSYGGGKVGARISVDGAIATLGSHVFTSRRLSQGFATVSVGNYDNVRIYADNHLVARTDRSGNAVVPSLRGYERNLIRIELDDLPLDTAVANAEISVRPFGHSGVKVDFEAARSRSAMLRIQIEGLGELPAGATIRVQGQDFLAAPGGQVFLAGLRDNNPIEVTWPEGRCSFTLVVPESDDPQPDLGVRSCVRPQAWAAQ